MKVSIDMDLCHDHYACVITAPEVFRLDENSKLVYDPEPSEEMRRSVEEAVSSCPEQAIRVEG